MKKPKARRKDRKRDQKKSCGQSGRWPKGRLVPPPDSDLWPQQCRGKRWKSVFAILFAGRCQLCAYACQPSEARRRLDKWAGLPPTLVCMNHPDSPGALREVLPTETCRNFHAKRWLPPRAKRARPEAATPQAQSDDAIRRIPLSRDLFALGDAADYEELSKYKWSASRRGHNVYASATINGRTVLMHRFLMRPPKGYCVDHIDGNGLNNRQCNLRVCTPGQNQANRRPRGGSSRFVGVCRRGDKWEAWIKQRGKWYTLGRYDDEVEAAKARDRKAYEIHGEQAYLNFPDGIHL